MDLGHCCCAYLSSFILVLNIYVSDQVLKTLHMEAHISCGSVRKFTGIMLWPELHILYGMYRKMPVRLYD